MLKLRCKNCNSEIVSHPTQLKICGCSNQTSVRGENVTAIDLNKVEIVEGFAKTKKKTRVLSDSDLLWQEERRRRGVRKLSFEVK